MTRTWSLTWLLLLVVALAPAAPALKEKAPKEPPIFGEWLRVDHTQAGTPVPPDHEPHHQVFNTNGVWQYSYGGRPQGARGMSFVVDAKQSPATVDISLNVGQVKWRGIYKVEGDTLTLCLVTGDGDRPKKFESSAEQPTTMWVFKRVMPKD